MSRIMAFHSPNTGMPPELGLDASFSPARNGTSTLSNDGYRGVLLPRRRQNRSCDHCRLGKRRCDVRLSNTGNLSSFTPCANCTRWKKQCTIDWIKTHEKRSTPNAQGHQRRQSSASTTAEEASRSTQPPAHAWSAIELSPEPPEGRPYPFRAISSQQPAEPHFNGHGHRSFTAPSSTNTMNGLRNSASGNSDYNEPYASSVLTSIDGLMFSGQYSPTGDLFPAAHAPISDSELSGNPHDALDNSIADGVVSWIRPAGESGSRDDDDQSQKNGRMTPRTAVRHAMFRPSSPYQSQFLAQDFNRIHIKEGLLRIYRDSMEGALSCWLTERNCPYSFAPFDGIDALDGKDVWGSNWASRMVTRVCALDKEYVKAGSLSRREQQEGSKVLGVVVMAFASQWSQAGSRYESAHNNTSTSSASSCAADPTMQRLSEVSFGRDIQKSLWHKASKALREASDNMSFEFIFAAIVFSLSQRPIDGKEVLRELDSTDMDELESLFKVLDLDGPTSWLDVANRKMQDHRRKLKEARHTSIYRSRAPTRLSQPHEETLGLLYWLAVMFDTLSAAINRRSFTISDTDTNLNRASSLTQLKTLRHNSAHDRTQQHVWQSEVEDASVWGEYFLRQQSRAGQERKQSTRWPCAYVEAASCLADAAPVKVLLYRRLGQLQSLYYQHSPASEIENGLEATMEVYNHWTNTYGLFIDDCIRNHEALPARIQSWYTLLTGHWSLAVLIFVDLVDTMDNACMTIPSHRNLRRSIGFTGHLRDTAIYSISELGRCCRSVNEPLAFAQSPDFHHAVNRAALLTEPWTVVLIKTFGYAGVTLARQASCPVPPDISGFAPMVADMTTERILVAKERLQYCIDALSLLGKKSDMAMVAATLLSRFISKRDHQRCYANVQR